MVFLWSILFGAALGIVSGFLTKRRDPGFLIVRAIIGIICCGVIAGIVAVEMPPTAVSSLWISLGGVIVLFFLWWIVAGKKKTT